MAETATAPPATQADPKQTAANIVKGVQAKATGKAPAAKGPIVPDDGDEKGKVAAVVDPNAGKKKYNVSGKDVWLTPEQADAYVQKGLAFEPKMDELSRMQREMVAFERALLDNPGQIMANLAKRANVPIQAIVEKVLNGNMSDEVKETTGKWYWENVAKRHKMDPKDLAILERDERIKTLEDQERQKTESALALENRARVQTALAQVKGQINESLKEMGIMDVDSVLGVQMAKRIAYVMRISYFSRQPVTAKEAAAKVREEVRQYQRSFYDHLDEEKLVEELGKENADKVRKYFLKIVKAAEKETKSNGDAPPIKRGERKTIGMDEFHDMLDDLKKGK